MDGDYSDTTLMIGNPGVGKSTLLNGLIGKIEFKAGVNYGTGLTCWLDQKWARGTCFIDTPGLSDIEKRTQAALEIEKALKKNGNYRIFFVVTLESGRIKSEDKTTMKLVLEAVKEIKADKYSIIVNKASKRICEDLQNSALTCLMQDKYFNTDLPGTTHIFYNPHDPLLFDEDNKLPSLSQEFRSFVSHAPQISVTKEKVEKIQVDLFDKLQQEQAKKLEELESHWKKKLQEKARELEEQKRCWEKAQQEQARKNAEEKMRWEKAQQEQAQRNAEEKMRWEKAQQEQAQRNEVSMLANHRANNQEERANNNQGSWSKSDTGFAVGTVALGVATGPIGFFLGGFLLLAKKILNS